MRASGSAGWWLARTFQPAAAEVVLCWDFGVPAWAAVAGMAQAGKAAAGLVTWRGYRVFHGLNSGGGWLRWVVTAAKAIS